MKTYLNTRYNFAIDIPDQWSIQKERTAFYWSFLFWLLRGWIPGIEVVFTNGPKEIVNIVVKRAKPENEDALHKQHIHDIEFMGGTIMDTGSITVMDKENKTIMYHYTINEVFVKYLIVLNGIAYAITCTTSDQNRLDQIFPAWIQVATSFRLLE